MTAPQRHYSARDAYVRVAEEYGVTPSDVRQLCGYAGKPNINYSDRLHLLRGKMAQAGMVPVQPVRTRIDPRSQTETEYTGEPRELRSCLLCNEFLHDDDPGSAVICSDDADPYEQGDTAVICSKCRDRQDMI